MYTEETTINLRILKAEEGKYLVKKDENEVIGNMIFLGIYDSEENYIEVTEDELKKLKAN